MAEEAEGKVSGRRRKEPLKPGHTLADWGRLCATGKITNGLGGLQHKVTPSELASHNKPDDAWIVFNGRVYNITPYLAFHPGGAHPFISLLYLKMKYKRKKIDLYCGLQC